MTTEREQRYADAMAQFFGDGVVASPEEHRLRFARAVMAVADAERDQILERLADVQEEHRKSAETWDRQRARLNAEIERLRGWIDRSDRMQRRAETAEAEVERLRQAPFMCDTHACGSCKGCRAAGVKDRLTEAETEIARLRQALAQETRTSIDATRRREEHSQAIDRVRALHRGEYGICTECTEEAAVPWPCPTLDALDKDDS